MVDFLVKALFVTINCGGILVLIKIAYALWIEYTDSFLETMTSIVLTIMIIIFIAFLGIGIYYIIA